MNLLSHKALVVLLYTTLAAGTARASIAYGSINNFDTVNDTGSECHGFEIELDDCHSTDITYTFNYNHYGVPKITEDNSAPAHPKVLIRWESKKNANGTWAAYTAIPAGPIAPTNGHMFTNPNVNFGGEHFGCGYRVQPSAVLYNWLIDNGGALVHGGAVQVSTPTFTYFPPVAGNPAPPQVQAVIAPPPPPVPPPLPFGKAVWVKEIKTTTHNNKEVKLRDLLSDDPDNPNDKNWKNGEPDQVEVEWRILQKNTGLPDGGVNNLVPAAAEPLPGGDEVVTRRYEFYKYVGPLDVETGEAMGDLVGPDGIHGSGTVTYADHWNPNIAEWATVTVDLSTVVIVGDFTGAQMAAVDVDAPVGLIDHCGEGKINTAFAARTVVIQGSRAFTSVKTGSLPPGMTFNDVSGVLSGTPTASGSFNFKVTASDGLNPSVAKNYTLNVAAAGVALPPASLLDTTVSPVGAGMTTGDGSYAIGANASTTATATAGYTFLNWTDNGAIVSTNSSYTLAMNVNHSLVANFVLDVVKWNVATSAAPLAGGSASGDGSFASGTSVTVVATANAGYNFANWTESGTPVSSSASYTFNIAATRSLVANFTLIPTYSLNTSAVPAAGGSTSGGGNFASGTSVTVVATPNAGYDFVNWTESGTPVSSSASYTFNIAATRTLVANFSLNGVTLRTITTSVTPANSGTTTGAGTYADGASVTVVATPNPGYKFSKWKDGSTTVSTSPSYTFNATANRTLVASFTVSWTITTSAFPANGGTTEMDSSSYTVGDTAQARIKTTSAGYQFVNWTENGAVVSTAAPYSFPATGNRTLVANFQLIGSVNVSANSTPAEGGSVSGAGVYVIGNNATLIATPKSGYVFDGWTENGTPVAALPSYTFSVTGARTLVAAFVAVPQITVIPGAAGTDTMTISWPVSANGWVLEECDDSATWLPSARIVTPVNAYMTVTISTNQGHRFFRLAHP